MGWESVNGWIVAMESWHGLNVLNGLSPGCKSTCPKHYSYSKDQEIQIYGVKLKLN